MLSKAIFGLPPPPSILSSANKPGMPKRWRGSEPVDGAVQVTTVDDSCHQVVGVGVVGEFAVEHAVLTDTQPTPRCMTSNWLDVEVRGIIQ